MTLRSERQILSCALAVLALGALLPAAAQKEKAGENEQGLWRGQVAQEQNGDLPRWRMRKRLGQANGEGQEGQFRQGNLPGELWRRQHAIDGAGPEAGDQPPFRRGPGQGGMPPGNMQRRGFPPGGGLGNHSLDLRPLALTEEQKEKVKQMRETTRAKIKDLHRSVLEKQADLRHLIFDPEATESQIRTAHSQLRRLQNKMDETNMEDVLSIRSMLTPEQRKRLPDCLPGKRATANGGFSPGGPPPAPEGEGFPPSPGSPPGPSGSPPGPPGSPPGPPALPPPEAAGGFNQQASEWQALKRRRAAQAARRRTLEAETNAADR